MGRQGGFSSVSVFFESFGRKVSSFCFEKRKDEETFRLVT